MAISKVILNGDTLMDVTSDTPAANNMLSGIKATKNDGTKVTGNIASKSSTDLSVSGATVTAPAGYYANAASKAVAAGSAFPPAVTITKAPTFSMNSSTGVITASYTGSSSITPTVNAGYVTAGTAGTISTAGTSTYTLATQGAQTITPGSTAQTIASNRWLTGTQTIAGDSNLKAENIAEGVSIFGVTGTHSGKAKHTATITAKGIYDMRGGIYCFVYVTVGQRHYTLGDTFEFSEGDTLKCCLAQYEHRSQVVIYVNGDVIYSDSGSSSASYYSYDYILPDYDIDIALTTTGASMSITTPTISITENGNYDVADYGYANVDVDTGAVLPSTFSITTAFNSSHWSIMYKSSYLSEHSTYTLNAGDSVRVINNSTDVKYLQRNYYTVCYIPPNSFAEIPLGPGTEYLYGAASYFDIHTKGMQCVEDLMFDQVISSSTSLVHVSIPNRYTWLGSCRFYQTAYLYSISGDNILGLEQQCMERCYSLQSAVFPKAKYIGTECFAYCSSLSTLQLDFDAITSIPTSCFFSCNKLPIASFPEVTYVASSAFAKCTSLSTVYMPKLSNLGSSAFAYCSNLTSIDFPNLSYIGSSAFAYCQSLSIARFSALTSIAATAFERCYNLLSLYLLGSSVPTLYNSAVFSSTPIAGYTTSTGGVYGSIFVPASLYNSYITATNWSRFSSRFVSV